MRKSRILTFLFGLMPGAGQMYLGYMKRGVSLMSMFFMLIFLAGFLNISFLLFLLPIIWFYAFFDTMNLRSMSYEFLPHDDFLLHFDSIQSGALSGFFRRRHLFGGILLVFLGIYILLHNTLLPFLYQAFNLDLYWLFDGIPTFAIAIVIIWLGIHLIRGTAHPKAIEDSYQEYQGGNPADSSQNEQK